MRKHERMQLHAVRDLYNILLMHLPIVSKGLINNYQHGFISKHCCITNLLECVDDWSLAFRGILPVDVIYLLISVRRLTAWFTLN